MLELYATAGESPVVERAAIMLEECGLPYKRHDIEVGKGARKPAELLRLNPRGTIPLLVDNDAAGAPIAIVQAGAIMLHLAEKSGRFLPKTAAERANVYQWLMSALTDAQPTSMAAFLIEMQVPGAASAEEYFHALYVDLCRFFDHRLAESTYLASDDISIADIALITTIVYRRRWVEKISDIPNLNRWINAMMARPAVKKILGDRK
jgi:GST-like protein